MWGNIPTPHEPCSYCNDPHHHVRDCPLARQISHGKIKLLKIMLLNFMNCIINHIRCSMITYSSQLDSQKQYKWWRSRHHFEGSRSSTNWSGYESTSKEVQGCTQRTHSRVMGSSKFVEAHWAWSTWATKNRHRDSSSRRIWWRLRIGKKYFRIILEG